MVYRSHEINIVPVQEGILFRIDSMRIGGYEPTMQDALDECYAIIDSTLDNDGIREDNEYN